MHFLMILAPFILEIGMLLIKCIEISMFLALLSISFILLKNCLAKLLISMLRSAFLICCDGSIQVL